MMSTNEINVVVPVNSQSLKKETKRVHDWLSLSYFHGDALYVFKHTQKKSDAIFEELLVQLADVPNPKYYVFAIGIEVNGAVVAARTWKVDASSVRSGQWRPEHGEVIECIPSEQEMKAIEIYKQYDGWCTLFKEIGIRVTLHYET